MEDCCNGSPELFQPVIQAVAYNCPWLVGLHITSAYGFTASTSFANPAVAIARAFSDAFAGIRPVDLPGFIAAELLGAGLALALAGWLFAELSPPASQRGRRLVTIHTIDRRRWEAMRLSERWRLGDYRHGRGGECERIKAG